VRFPHIETEYPPYVVVSGLPFNIQKPSATFDIDIEQYTQLAKGSSQMTMFPASCTIIDSPRWSKVPKPVPFPEKYITASRYLAGVEDSEVQGSPHARRFKINLDNVIWLGNSPAAAPSTPGKTLSLLFSGLLLILFFVVASSSKRKEFDSTPSWVKAKNKAKRTIEGDAPSSSPSGSR
jgi:hypothetical protein